MDDRSSTSRADIAVAIHDVAPATFARAALIRDWLDDHGIDRVTLLVVPAPDLHPFSTSSPELADWLLERARHGDAIVQHGLTSRETGFAGLGEPAAPAPAVRLSPLGLRASALLGGPLLRIDLRPSDLEHTRRMVTLERVLRRGRRRTAVIYDKLAVA
jgi:hypothetical protein